MTSRLFASLALVGTAFLGLSGLARANENEPGSLLVYPIFDNTRGTFSAFTVTNANDDVVDGSVDVEFVYIEDTQCLEFNRTHRLTANDTLTVVPKFHNPNYTRGYCYLFAKSPTTGRAIAWDHLIGTNLFLQSFGVYDFEVNAIVYKAGEGLAQGDNTDLDNDGLRDLDGAEYEMSADEILVPRFFGNGNAVQTDLILIGLTGARFTTIVNFLVYNDNEEVFSAQHQFDCWQRSTLLDISGVFSNYFLKSTNHNPNEIQGVPNLEQGWYRIDGNLAFSTVSSEVDPAFLALQVERLVGGHEESKEVGDGAVASVPFHRGKQDNGALLSLSIFGDQDL